MQRRRVITIFYNSDKSDMLSFTLSIVLCIEIRYLIYVIFMFTSKM